MGLSERDETADFCLDKKGKIEPDSTLRDTEIVPLKQNIQEYFGQQVLPFFPDAWIDETKTKLGYEIPFTREFYKFEAPENADEIEIKIKDQAKVIIGMLNALLDNGGFSDE